MTLTQDLVRDLLNCDYEAGTLTWRERPGNNIFNARYAGRPAFTARDTKGYLKGGIRGKQYRTHRVIFLHYHGWMPPEVDHENGVRDDNRISNLLPANKTINSKNRSIQSNNTSGITGVNYHKQSGRWQARVKHAGKRHSLRTYTTKEAAESAVIAKRKELGGFTERHGK